MFTEILNPFLYVRNRIKNTSGQWVDHQKPREEITQYNQSSIETDSNTDITIFEIWDKKVILENIIVKSDANPVLSLDIRQDATDYTGNLFFTMGGEGYYLGSVNAVKNRGSEYFEHIDHDADGDERDGVMLKKPIILPQGARLTLEGSEDEGTTAYKVVFRTIEE